MPTEEGMKVARNEGQVRSCCSGQPAVGVPYSHIFLQCRECLEIDLYRSKYKHALCSFADCTSKEVPVLCRPLSPSTSASSPWTTRRPCKAIVTSFMSASYCPTLLGLFRICTAHFINSCTSVMIKRDTQS